MKKFDYEIAKAIKDEQLFQDLLHGIITGLFGITIN